MLEFLSEYKFLIMTISTLLGIVLYTLKFIFLTEQKRVLKHFSKSKEITEHIENEKIYQDITK